MFLPTAYLTSTLCALLGLGLGRQLAMRGSGRLSAWVLLGASGFVFLGVWWFGGPGGDPLGYANANAALAMQLAALALLAALRATGRDRSALLIAAALATLAVPATFSRAAIVLLVPLALAVTAAFLGWVRSRWWPGAVGGGVIAASAVGVVLLASRPALQPGLFDSVRRTLWSDAFTLWARHPLTGAGPGSFRRFSDLAKDPDTAAVHSSVLQVGAEWGILGVVVLAGLIVGAFILVARGVPKATLIGSAAFTALMVHSLVDHVLEFWLVALAAGAVLGYAASGSEELDVSEREGPG